MLSRGAASSAPPEKMMFLELGIPLVWHRRAAVVTRSRGSVSGGMVGCCGPTGDGWGEISEVAGPLGDETWPASAVSWRMLHR